MSNQKILPATPKKPGLTNWLLLFVAILLVAQLFIPKEKEATKEAPLFDPNAPITVETIKDEFVQGQPVLVKVTNNTQSPITIPVTCPTNPLIVLAFNGRTYEERTASTEAKCDLITDIVIAPENSEQISFTYWNNALFGELGRYKVSVPYTSPDKLQEPLLIESPEFEITAPGFFRRIGRTFFYIPIYNALVFLIEIAPGSSLGFAIIALTLFLRLILLIPSQKAMNAQRRMQTLQPKLAHIKEKYKGNQERIAMETMKLWKENKVNPFGSCAPMLIQFPILIALFYVIRNGLNPDQSYLIYSFLKGVDISHISTNFLGVLELMTPNRYVLPLIVGGLQFFQMKLATATNKKKNEVGSEMEIANKSMLYVLPVMIAVFTTSLPAGVGLYWATSTAFAIGQQFVANKKIL